jgi:transposase-like protein
MCLASRPARFDLIKAMGMTGISKSQVSRLCEEIDERVKAFLSRPIEGDWPYLWIVATYVKARESGRIVSAAVIVAVGVNRTYLNSYKWYLVCSATFRDS